MSVSPIGESFRISEHVQKLIIKLDIPDLTPAQVAQFTPIIDDILSNADLSTITPKKIILGLQERLGFDITELKVSPSANSNVEISSPEGIGE